MTGRRNYLFCPWSFYYWLWFKTDGGWLLVCLPHQPPQKSLTFIDLVLSTAVLSLALFQKKKKNHIRCWIASLAPVLPSRVKGTESSPVPGRSLGGTHMRPVALSRNLSLWDFRIHCQGVLSLAREYIAVSYQINANLFHKTMVLTRWPLRNSGSHITWFSDMMEISALRPYLKSAWGFCHNIYEWFFLLTVSHLTYFKKTREKRLGERHTVNKNNVDDDYNVYVYSALT